MPEQTGTYTATVGSETEVFNTSSVVTSPQNIFIRIFLTNLASGDNITFYVYQQDNAGTYRLVDSIQCSSLGYWRTGFLSPNPSKVLVLDGMYVSNTAHIKVTGKQTSGTARQFPWKYNTR